MKFKSRKLAPAFGLSERCDQSKKDLYGLTQLKFCSFGLLDE
jgi:hypothetical protein